MRCVLRALVAVVCCMMLCASCCLLLVRSSLVVVCCLFVVLLVVVCCQLFAVVHCSLFVAFCLLVDVYCLLPAAWLIAACSLLYDVCCVSSAVSGVRCLLFVVNGLLLGGCCRFVFVVLLFDVGWLLCVVCKMLLFGAVGWLWFVAVCCAALAVLLDVCCVVSGAYCMLLVGVALVVCCSRFGWRVSCGCCSVFSVCCCLFYGAC